MAAPMTMDEFAQFKRDYREFIDLDTKKVGSFLDKQERIRWAELHGVMLSKLFDQPFHEYFDMRESIRVPVEHETVVIKGKIIFPCRAIDLSVGGVRTYAHIEISAKDSVVVKLALSKKKKLGLFPVSLKLEGKVAWVSHEMNRMGIQFVNLSPNTKAELMKFIHQDILDFHVNQLLKKVTTS